jgi:molecular chaperone GrpE
MIYSQFQQFLKSQGVSEIQAAGQTFDPSLHEAVAHEASDAPEGQVTQQIRKGYKLHEKVLRPATVIVSKGKDAEA